MSDTIQAGSDSCHYRGCAWHRSSCSTKVRHTRFAGRDGRSGVGGLARVSRQSGRKRRRGKCSGIDNGRGRRFSDGRARGRGRAPLRRTDAVDEQCRNARGRRRDGPDGKLAHRVRSQLLGCHQRCQCVFAHDAGGAARRSHYQCRIKTGDHQPAGNAAYNATKAALRFYTESLQHDLRGRPGCRVTAHLLVPGWTTTGTNMHKPGAWLPEQVVERMLEKLAVGSFYIVCPDNEVSEAMDRQRILWAATDITNDRPPLSRWHGEHDDEFKAFKV